MFLKLKKFLYDWGLTILFATLALSCLGLVVVSLVTHFHKGVVALFLFFSVVLGYGSCMSNPFMYRNSKGKEDS